MTQTYKLITELNENTSSMIVESTSEGKQYFFEGVYIQSNVKNRNGRIYPRAMMEEEVNRYIQDKVLQNRAVGELGHPPTPTVDYSRACHKIISLIQEGDNWIGRSKVMTSLPMGLVVKGLIDEGVQFGTSTRGVGALRNNNNITEVHNYKIATAGDVVSDPSAPDAFVRGIMEGAEFIYDPITDSFHQQKLVEQIRKSLDKPSRLVTEEMKLQAFQRFLESFNK